MDRIQLFTIYMLEFKNDHNIKIQREMTLCRRLLISFKKTQAPHESQNHFTMTLQITIQLIS